MTNDDIIQWITSGMKKGVKTEDLKKSLRDAGHSDSQIKKAFEEACGEDKPGTGKKNSLLPAIVAAVIVVMAVVAFALNSDLLGRREGASAEGERLTAEGINLFNAGEYRQAEPLFREALKLNSSDNSALYYLGWILFETGGDLNEAEEFFTRAIDLDSSNVWYYIGLGTVLLKEGKDAEAGQAFSTAKEVDPTNAISSFGLAVVSLRKGDSAGAQKLFDEGRSLSSEERLRSALKTWPELETLMS